jgi:hypothetical protein
MQLSLELMLLTLLAPSSVPAGSAIVVSTSGFRLSSPSYFSLTSAFFSVVDTAFDDDECAFEPVLPWLLSSL